MLTMRILIATTLVAVVTTVASAETATTTQATTTTGPTVIPDKIMKNIESMFKFPTKGKPMSGKRRMTLLISRMSNVMKLSDKALAQYPNAENLHELQFMRLRATMGLASAKRNKETYEAMMEAAKIVMASKTPPENKVQADRILTFEKIKPIGNKINPEAVQTGIHAMIARYTGTKAEAIAVIYGTIMAKQLRQEKLVDELAQTLEKKHIDVEGVQLLLRRLGKNPPMGKFEAKLKRLDGSTLTMPNDLLGKVVVIDFWATWCGPCVKEIPHMKELYAKYKSKGVEFVGISLDGKKGKLERFVKDKQLGWIQTYSGQKWDDPTAKKYGIGGIPSIWVVGKDGNIVSTDARRNLEETIKKALEKPITAAKP